MDKDGNEVMEGERGLLLFYRGTVCDDNFDVNAANIICQQMGYTGAVSWTSGTYYRIQKELEINLDDIQCSGNTWSSCTYSKASNCGHGEDVFLACNSQTGCNISFI